MPLRLFGLGKSPTPKAAPKPPALTEPARAVRKPKPSKTGKRHKTPPKKAVKRRK